MKIIIAPNGERHTDDGLQGYGIDGGTLFFRYYSPGDTDRRTFICHILHGYEDAASEKIDIFLCGLATNDIFNLRSTAPGSIFMRPDPLPAPESGKHTSDNGYTDFQQFEDHFGDPFYDPDIDNAIGPKDLGGG